MMQAFAFLNIDHPIVAWGAYRAILVSSNAEYQPPQCPVSMMFAGIILGQNNVRFCNELLIEKYRQKHFPSCQSRLTGMYFFEERNTAKHAYEWGGHFSPKYLAELELYPTSAIFRHDANWITHAPIDKRGRIKSEEWIPKYWSGQEYPGKIPVWELIVQGRAVICGTELRERAYQNILKKFPGAVSILEVSRIAAHVGSDLGQVSAWIIRKSERLMDLSFYLDMRDADNPEFLERVQLYNGPRNHKDLAVGGEKFQVPDFREFSCQFLTDSELTDKFLLSVHRTE